MADPLMTEKAGNDYSQILWYQTKYMAIANNSVYKEEKVLVHMNKYIEYYLVWNDLINFNSNIYLECSIG